MSDQETKNLLIQTSGPLKLVALKKDPVPAKAQPTRDAWVLIQPSSAVRVCTGDDNHEEGVIRRGDLALLLPGFGHSLHRHQPSVPFGFNALHMEGPFPEPLLGSLQNPPRKWQEASFAVLRSQSLKQLFHIFTTEIQDPDGIQLMTRELFLILLGAELSRLTEKEDRGRFPYRLNRSTLQLVLDHMEGHLGGKNSVPELAIMARCTPDHFIRLFREATGTTPHQHLIERRLQRAVQMLSNGERPSDVAKLLGFYDASAFTRAFKRRFGVPPSEYAEEAYRRQFPKRGE
ncbi:MAG TPA: helix-turn-helix transcriptional regulator [Holophagaceae bacterium]|jgi:AraC-like DNA-binding protein|nr:helix-turn-helix transcriptional regulator [Holophagaceae bacterium]